MPKKIVIRLVATIKRDCHSCDTLTKCFVLDKKVNKGYLYCSNCLLDLLALKKHILLRGTALPQRTLRGG